MRYIKFDFLEDKIKLCESPIISINFENRKNFFKCIFDIKNSDEDSTKYFNDSYTDLNLSKESIFIDSYLLIDLNEKKTISQVYKDMETHMSPSQTEQYNSLVNEIVQFVEEISLDLEGEVEIEDNIPLSKLLPSVDLHFAEEDINNVLDRFIKYLQITKNIKPFRLVFTIDFLKLLNNDEINSLNEELKLLELQLIDLSYYTDNRNKPIRCINIDADLCEF